MFVISTATSILILLESIKPWKKKKPVFDPLADKSLDDSNLDINEEKTLWFKALEDIINRVWGETAIEKHSILFNDTKKLRSKYSDTGEKPKFYASQVSEEKFDKWVIATDPGLNFTWKIREEDTKHMSE